jgi:hypothetical protein
MKHSAHHPDRLPNEKNSNISMAARNRLLQQEVVLIIAGKIAKETGSPLGQLELKQLIAHIKRLDGNIFATMPIEEATSRVAKGYIGYTSTTSDVIYNTHEIMKQYIGGGVEAKPDLFMIQKGCGTIGGLGPDLASVQHQGSSVPAYAMFPRIEGVGGRVELPMMKQPIEPPRTIAEEEYALMKKGKDADRDGVALPGAYVKKGNVIRPRETSISVLLDSRYRVRSTGPSLFTWALTALPSDSPGVVSAQAGMKNIIYMKFEPFNIPYVATADTPNKLITLLIEELVMSSVIGHESRHFHILCDTEIVTNQIRCTPKEDKYRFSEPVTCIQKMSVSFAAPLTQVNFLPDTYPIVVSVNGPSSTYLTFLVEHFVSDGEIVLITGFTTANPSRDFAAIGAVNSVNGNTVAVVDDFTLEIAVDLTSATMLTSPPNVECYISSRRIFIPIRFAHVI